MERKGLGEEMSEITTLRKIKAWESESESKWAKWETNAKESFAFAHGEQWKPDIKSKVEEEGRPAYTFNEIRGVLKFVTGFQRQNRQDIKIVGVEGGDDVTANIMTLLIKNAVTKQNGEYKFSDCFSDGVKCSRGFLEIEIDYDEDILNGVITIHQRSPFEVKVDPYSVEYDLSDANYIIRTIPNLTKDMLLSRFPDQKDKVIEATSSQEHDSEKDHWKLTECWYKVYSIVKFLVDTQSGDIKELGKVTKKQEEQLLKVSKSLQIYKRRIPKIKIGSVVGEVLLQDDDSPYYPHLKTFPFIPYICDWTPSASKLEHRCQGIVDAIKDPQRLINKQTSMALHIINTSANAPWIGDDDALDEEGEANLKKFGSRPGIYIKKKKGSELRREPPVSGTLSQFVLTDRGSDQIKRISGIDTNLMAQTEMKSMSGKALEIRQQQGKTAIQEMFDNLRLTRHIEARLIIGLILHSYTPEKVVRICGEEKITLEQASMILKNIDMTQYDIAIDEISASATMRAVNYLIMLEMKEKGFESISEADLIESSDLPNKEKILARIKKQEEEQPQGVPLANITQKQRR